ncbi:MAG TPA: divalent-cation tolerance protein CutA [Burkholderiaceae bacterium]|nr:divalent-cation tolerance protein CutA [Burkholderiaceae bacterium]
MNQPATFHWNTDSEGSDDVVIALSNAPDLLIAKRIAHYLVEEGLAACVNLGAEMLSMYMWKGQLEGNSEVPFTIKTTRGNMPKLAARLSELHPYEVPELVVLPVIGGSKAYLDWVKAPT